MIEASQSGRSAEGRILAAQDILAFCREWADALANDEARHREVMDYVFLWEDTLALLVEAHEFSDVLPRTAQEPG